jgi:hypothetical protein
MTVQVMNNGVPEQRQVTVGLSDYQYTEIKDGLEEGDQVIISSLAASTPASTTNTNTDSQRGSQGGPPEVWEG